MDIRTVQARSFAVLPPGACGGSPVARDPFQSVAHLAHISLNVIANVALTSNSSIDIPFGNFGRR